MCSLAAVSRAILNLQPPRAEAPPIEAKIIEAPSYVKTLDASLPAPAQNAQSSVVAARRIILVYKHLQTPPIRTAAQSLRNLPKQFTQTAKPTDDLIGTPLEDDADDILELIDVKDVLQMEQDGAGSSGRHRAWRDGEDSYGPVALDECRRILNAVNAMPCEEKAASVWTLCGGGDSEANKSNGRATTTVAVPGGGECHRDFLLLMWRFDQKWNTEGFCRFTGWHHYRDIDVQKLRGQHLSYLRKSIASVAIDVSAQYEAHFHVNASQTVCLTWDAAPMSSATVQASDGKPLAFSALATSGYRRADVVVANTLRIGGNLGGGSGAVDGTDTSSRGADAVVADLWRQLLRLDGIMAAIIEYRARNTPGLTVPPQFASGSALSMNTIQERVQKILLDAELFFELDAVGVATSTMNELEPVIVRSARRNLSEITDQLWMLLKLCASYEDLKTALNYVFLCAAKCNVNTPNASTRLGTIIGEITRQRLAVPCLSGAEPLELLLEIGLQKAVRDYAYVFGESNLCVNAEEFMVAAQLCGRKPKGETATNEAPPADRASVRKTMMQSIDTIEARKRDAVAGDGAAGSAAGLQNSLFDRFASEQQLSRLAHVHLLMEHVLQVQINLNCQDFRDYVAADLRRVAKPFAVYKTLIHDVREIPLPASANVVSKVESVEPNLVKIRMQSQSKFVSVQNTFVYSTHSLFPGNVFPQLQPSDEQTRDSPAFCGLNFVQLGTLKM